MAAEEGDRTRLDRLLVGHSSESARQYFRIAVALALGQALFTVLLGVLVDSYGLAARNLPAFAATLVLAGVLLAVLNGARSGGLLLSVTLTLAPLVGAIPVTLIRVAVIDESLLATGLMVAGLGVWAGLLAFALGRGIRAVQIRLGGRPPGHR